MPEQDPKRHQLKQLSSILKKLNAENATDDEKLAALIILPKLMVDPVSQVPSLANTLLVYKGMDYMFLKRMLSTPMENALDSSALMYKVSALHILDAFGAFESITDQQNEHLISKHVLPCIVDIALDPIIREYSESDSLADIKQTVTSLSFEIIQRQDVSFEAYRCVLSPLILPKFIERAMWEGKRDSTLSIFHFIKNMLHHYLMKSRNYFCKSKHQWTLPQFDHVMEIVAKAFIEAHSEFKFAMIPLIQSMMESSLVNHCKKPASWAITLKQGLRDVFGSKLSQSQRDTAFTLLHALSRYCSSSFIFTLQDDTSIQKGKSTTKEKNTLKDMGDSKFTLILTHVLCAEVRVLLDDLVRPHEPKITELQQQLASIELQQEYSDGKNDKISERDPLMLCICLELVTDLVEGLAELDPETLFKDAHQSEQVSTLIQSLQKVLTETFQDVVAYIEDAYSNYKADLLLDNQERKNMSDQEWKKEQYKKWMDHSYFATALYAYGVWLPQVATAIEQEDEKQDPHFETILDIVLLVTQESLSCLGSVSHVDVLSHFYEFYLSTPKLACLFFKRQGDTLVFEAAMKQSTSDPMILFILCRVFKDCLLMDFTLDQNASLYSHCHTLLKDMLSWMDRIGFRSSWHETPQSVSQCQSMVEFFATLVSRNAMSDAPFASFSDFIVLQQDMLGYIIKFVAFCKQYPTMGSIEEIVSALNKCPRSSSVFEQVRDIVNH